MNYSRRQLYAMGELLGECITRKEGGRVIYGGGGSGGGSSTQSGTQTSITELPEWAKPYAKDTLSKASALTDINQNPYQTYGGNRIAGFSDMQKNAMTGAQNMTTAPQLDAASGMAGIAGSKALGANYDPGQFNAQQVSNQNYTGQNVSQYMNPYMQNVVDIQQREAQRQADVAGTQRAGQAVKSGAFGGSRAGLMDAEAARNLALQKGDIQAQGQNAAFQNAQQQFNSQQGRDLQAQMANQQQNMTAQQLGEQSRQFGANYGMQGLQTGLQAAGQLGTLGGQQFAQGMDINKLQAGYGGMQQQLEQQGLSQNYQDFLNQQNYPYKQLGFMSDILRGTPTGSSSVTQMYQPAPGGLQQIAGLGMGAYGLGQLFGRAGGGSVHEYAGGGSVTSEDNVAEIVDKLSDQQLQVARQNAMMRKDVGTIKVIDEELAQRASERSGMSAAFNQLPPNAQENMYKAANGGIVSFQTGGINMPAVTGRTQNDQDAEDLQTALQNEQDGAEEDDEDVLTRAIQGGSTTPAYRTALLQAIRQANQQPAYKTRTADERQADIKSYYDKLQGMFGDNKAKEFLEKNLKDSETDRTNSLREGKGLAALAAMEGVLSRPGLVQGLGAAGSRFAGVYGDALKQDKAEKRALANMQFNLLDAERKEKMGLTRDALALTQEAEKDYRAAQRAHNEKRFSLANALSRAAPAFKEPPPPKPTKATQPNANNTMLADIKAGIREENPDWSEAKVNKTAAETVLTMKSGLPAAKVRAEVSTEDREARRLSEAEKALPKLQVYKSKWTPWVTKYGSETAAREAFKKAYAKLNPEGTEGRMPTLEDAAPAASTAPAAPAVRTQNW